MAQSSTAGDEYWAREAMAEAAVNFAFDLAQEALHGFELGVLTCGDAVGLLASAARFAERERLAAGWDFFDERKAA